MKLVHFHSSALLLVALSGMALATGSDEKLVPAAPPSGRTPVAPTPAPTGSSVAPMIATCLPAIRDQAGAGCIQASSVPTFGHLLPLSDYFNVTPLAEVGVGTASPEGTLHLLAQTGYASTVMDGPSGTRCRYRQNGVPKWDVYAGTNGYAISRFGIDFPLLISSATGDIEMTNRVGIGTSSPQVELDVQGDIMLPSLPNRLYFGDIGENNDSYYLFRANGANNESVLVVQMGDDNTATFPRDRLDIQNGQEVLVSFQSNGTCSNKTGAWTVLSDRNKKKNIQPLGGALEQLLELEGVTYEYIDPSEMGASGGVHMGFVAQDVETVFPSWVDTRPDETKMLTIQGFEALAVESLRELRTEKDTQVARLQAENDELRERVERLESFEIELTRLKATVATLVENR